MNIDEETRERLAQLEEDDRIEWWKASKIDDYNITKKLIRNGCRPLNR